jgi:hypothetical protein
MSSYNPIIDSYELIISNPKDMLVARCRSMMLDIATKGSYKIEFSPSYYRGVAVSLENTFVVEALSELKFSDQISGYGDYNG